MKEKSKKSKRFYKFNIIKIRLHIIQQNEMFVR